MQYRVRVSTGDRVATGDTLGECGNSGMADDSLVARGEPVRGQRIRP